MNTYAYILTAIALYAILFPIYAHYIKFPDNKPLSYTVAILDFIITVPYMMWLCLVDVLVALYVIILYSIQFIVEILSLPNFVTTARYGGLFLNVRSMKKVRECLPDDHPFKKKVP